MSTVATIVTEMLPMLNKMNLPIIGMPERRACDLTLRKIVTGRGGWHDLDEQEEENGQRNKNADREGHSLPRVGRQIVGEEREYAD